MSKVNFLNLNRAAMASFFAAIDEKPFRAQQVLQWIHQYGVTDFLAMSNLKKELREKLAFVAEIKMPEIAHEHISADGTRKWLIRLFDGNSVETVFIPEDDRGTLCISSQVGCTLNCSFCSTGKQGFNRNLTVAEIIGQVWLAVRRLSKDGTTRSRDVTNVVMMGMGEPLLNFDAVVAALDIMMDDLGYNLSKYRVTLSTAGMVPAMLRLKEKSPCALAVSLHAPNDALRNELVPLNKKYPLSELIPVCRDYFADEPRRVVMFEYVMLANINDTPEHAKQLIKLLKGVPCKINLIPFNPFPMSSYRSSPMPTIRQFQALLKQAGFNVTIRKTRGEDVDAACGQLVGQVADRTQRAKRWKMKHDSSKPD